MLAERSHSIRYYRARWPEVVVPEGEPSWFYYEVDHGSDVVTRAIEIFDSGTIKRNSLELEQRHGDHCLSLIGDSWSDLAANAVLEELPGEQFEELWLQGIDAPFWFPDRQ